VSRKFLLSLHDSVRNFKFSLQSGRII
jgi:hypothetical protein